MTQEEALQQLLKLCNHMYVEDSQGMWKASVSIEQLMSGRRCVKLTPGDRFKTPVYLTPDAAAIRAASPMETGEDE